MELPVHSDMTKTPAPDAAVLLPCPFCGGEAKVHGPYGWYRQYGITHSCKAFYTGAQDAFKNYPTVEYAIAAWNTRLAALAPAGGEYVLVPRDLVGAALHCVRKVKPDGNTYRLLSAIAFAPPPPTSEPGADVDGIARVLFSRREPDTDWEIAKQHGKFSDIASVRDNCIADARAIAAALSTSTAAGEEVE